MASAKKILMVFTAHNKLGDTDEQTGWYLPEAAHPYYVFKEAGFEISFAAPVAGTPPVDESSIAAFAEDAECVSFLGDDDTKALLESTAALDAVEGPFDAVFTVGGFGVMWDLPENTDLQKLYATTYENGGVAAAVCHGPAALVNVALSDGTLLVAGKKVTAFSNAEEHAVSRYDIVPWTCENKLAEQGAEYSCADAWGENVVVDGNLITGQNPASARATAAAVVAALQ